ncbi:hypothetical protein EXW39_06690 [Bacillus mycoides]|uniref:hypothetical protein n=1 Tax=Bacillus mycoides TaxID=1405 RepID=UPI000278D454|nr:hypothetical protein [Bacillus mycoides]EJQ61745.1 hypothetical protein IEY_04230 [Bacillus mycoides]EJQ64619.1 hypothetical protein IEW_01103 [Bacillus mycoides]EJV71487.1 hypothetical protein IEU_01104 [Bacillus mycoides]MDR4299650.1 hypothetical protein [Bacillus mycoides]QWH59863.1 hypothetical protein EXW39_06690 [Bacillus mycoides]
MSFTEVVDIAKIVGAVVGVWGIIKGFGSFYMESSTTNEFDQLFKDKTKRKQMDIFMFWQDIVLAAICVFILPALYFKIFIPNVPIDYSFIFKTLYQVSALLFSLIFLILLIITATLPFIKPNKNNLFCRITRYVGLLNMINFMFIYWVLFNIKIDIGLFQTSKNTFILIAIFLPLFMSFFYKYLNQQLRDRHQTQYLVESLSEEKIKELQLIHNFIIDDKRSVLHEKYKEENGTFYVCDFSSKVYLKYSKMKTRKDSSK